MKNCGFDIFSACARLGVFCTDAAFSEQSGLFIHIVLASPFFSVDVFFSVQCLDIF